MEKISVTDTQAFMNQTPGCLLLDVREAFEFESEHAVGAKLVPLSNLEKGASSLEKDLPLLVICQKGGRAAQAAERLTKLGFSQVKVVDGGTDAWKLAGQPVEKRGKQVWAMDRQVRMAAGSFVVAGFLGALLVHPYFLALSFAIGAGLVFSAVTNTCGMALVLARMPWNQVPSK